MKVLAKTFIIFHFESKIVIAKLTLLGLTALYLVRRKTSFLNCTKTSWLRKVSYNCNNGNNVTRGSVVCTLHSVL
jgi:hypothetical protein